MRRLGASTEDLGADLANLPTDAWDDILAVMRRAIGS
jgi:hypothetical protein